MAKKGDRKRKKGEIIDRKTIKLPKNTVEKLKILKKVYEEDRGTSVAFDIIIERLFSSLALGNIDPSIYKRFTEQVNLRPELNSVAKRPSHRSNAVSGKPTITDTKKDTTDVKTGDPTKGDIWKMKYFFVRGNQKLEAQYTSAPLYFVVKNERTKGVEQMWDEGWKLINENGIEIDSKDTLLQIDTIIWVH